MTTNDTSPTPASASVQASTIKPGILVALRTSVNGGVRYERTDLPAEQVDGKDVARWETKRVIEDPAEYESANKARMAASKEIRRCCAETSFGLLCAAADEAELNAAYVRAREIVDAFNRGARYSSVTLYLLKGRIASTDAEAARAIGAEVSSLIERMNEGIDRLDPEAIRKAATEALQMSAVLSEERQLSVSAAVEAARKAARAIVKRVQKEGEVAAVVLADIQRGAIEKARIAFLDTDADAAPAASPAEEMPAVEVARVAGLDIDLDESPPVEASPTPPPASAVRGPAFELDEEEVPRAL